MAPHHPSFHQTALQISPLPPFIKRKQSSQECLDPSQWPPPPEGGERERGPGWGEAKGGAIASTPAVTSQEPRPLSGWGEKVYRSGDLSCNAWPLDQCFRINSIASSATTGVSQVSESLRERYDERLGPAGDRVPPPDGCRIMEFGKTDCQPPPRMPTTGLDLWSQLVSNKMADKENAILFWLRISAAR